MKPIKKLFWFLKALTACIVYGFPSRKITLIGVTGTDGKTSTSTAIFHSLKSLKQKVSYISTVKAEIGGKQYETGLHTTTPSPFFIQRSLRDAVKNGDRYFVIETTSHAIDQYRVWGSRFTIGVLTNITREHLDYHKNLDSYGKTKLKLINDASIGIVNADNPTHYLFKKNVRNKNVWYTSTKKKADYNFEDLVKNGYTTPCDGFQCENVTLAYATLVVLGFDKAKAARALNTVPSIIGRLDYLEKNGKRFIVDFAHTPNAFERLYEYIPPHWGYTRLIHVFGCAGLRDQQKRMPMGRIAARHADSIIVTEEDYRTEKIEDIYAEIVKGIKKAQRPCSYTLIPNRQEAITEAVRQAGPLDLILITGKAHERSLCRGTKEYEWSDYSAIDTAIAAV